VEPGVEGSGAGAAPTPGGPDEAYLQSTVSGSSSPPPHVNTPAEALAADETLPDDDAAPMAE